MLQERLLQYDLERGLKHFNRVNNKHARAMVDTSVGSLVCVR